MTITERARTASIGMRAQLDHVAIPDPVALVRRARRRRQIGAAPIAILVLLAAGAGAVARHGSGGTPVSSRPPSDHLPAGSIVSGRWALVPTQATGLGSSSSFYAVASTAADSSARRA